MAGIGYATISHRGAQHVVDVLSVVESDHDTAKVIARGPSVMDDHPFITYVRKSAMFMRPEPVIPSEPEYILLCPRCSEVLNDEDSDEIYCPRGCVI